MWDSRPGRFPEKTWRTRTHGKKIGGMAICADIGNKDPVIRGQARSCPRIGKAIGDGEEVVILRQA